MKTLRGSSKISLIGSQRAQTTCKNKLFKCHKYHHKCRQNNILLYVFEVCKLQKRAEQFMELFNVFEIKILGYYLEFSALPENFFFLLSYFPSFVWALTHDGQPSEALSLCPLTPLWTN